MTVSTTETPSDTELLQRMIAGDEAAFVTLYRRRQNGIYRFALHMSGSAAIAEDVTQEVFIVLLGEAAHYDATRGSLAAYLYGIARNLVLRCLKLDRSYVPLSDDQHWEREDVAVAEQLIAADNPFNDLARSELINRVRQAVLHLPTCYREVVVLCELHEMSYAEAAAVLGCAVGTVRSRLHRARALLVERLRAKKETTAQKSGSTRCLA